MKKQFILITLVFCLIAPATVTCLWLNLQKKEVKRAVKRDIIKGIDKSELVLIHLSKAEANKKLEWEHSKEFEFEGEMYDVVEFAETADSIKYWCWWDHEETKLNQNLAKLVNKLLGNHPDRNEKELKLISFYQSLFSEKVFHWQALQFKQMTIPITSSQFRLDPYFINIPTPPPQAVV